MRTKRQRQADEEELRHSLGLLRATFETKRRRLRYDYEDELDDTSCSDASERHDEATDYYRRASKQLMHRFIAYGDRIIEDAERAWEVRDRPDSAMKAHLEERGKVQHAGPHQALERAGGTASDLGVWDEGRGC